jgi:ketosteroid isomerase-like protein
MSRREHIELVIAFLDAIRRGDREAAEAQLDPGIVWTGLAPDQGCSTPTEVVEVWLGRREQPIEVDRLELVADEAGAVFAFHLPDPQPDLIDATGPVYHALSIEGGKVTRITAHRALADAVAAL